MEEEGLSKLLRSWWRRRKAVKVTQSAAPEERVRTVPSVAALALIGDAVFELHVRVKAVEAGISRGRDLHGRTSARARAAAQAATLKALYPELTPQEQDVARRGRNAHTGRVPKGATSEEYHLATAFETLLGHLFLLGESDRLADLLEKADAQADQSPTEDER